MKQQTQLVFENIKKNLTDITMSSVSFMLESHWRKNTNVGISIPRLSEDHFKLVFEQEKY